MEAEDVKRDLQKFYSVENTKIFVMPYTAIPKKEWFSLDDVKIDKYHLPDQYFLISNQFWVHKDHGTAFAALKLLHDAGYEKYHIVCTGQTDDYRNRGYFQSLIEDLRKNHLEAYVHFLGYIPKIEQMKILCQAQAALQPTLFEGNPGGGIAYNAIAMGVPILLSDIPVNLELQSPLAFFFKKHDPESLKEAMIDLIMHRAELPSYSEKDLVAQGEERLEKLAQAVHEALLYNLEGKR
ncbi:MAG: glycosyltransferase [Negativicutes bacterium]